MTQPRASARRQKFRSYFGQKNDYRIFVGVPPGQPKRWDEVFKLEDEMLMGADLRAYSIQAIHSWVVAYAGTGEVVDGEGLFEPLPEGIISIIREANIVAPRFSSADLDNGRAMAQIRFGPSPTHPEKTAYYSTALTNISNTKFSCYAFGAYRRTIFGFRLCNVTGALFSAGQFAEWYGVRRGGWIEPNETVCDPSNYGSNCTWVYHCRTGEGVVFHVGQHRGASGLLGVFRRLFAPRQK
jgi:hypothetical protein